MNNFEEDECFYGGASTNDDLDFQTAHLSESEMVEAEKIGNALASWVMTVPTASLE